MWWKITGRAWESHGDSLASTATGSWPPASKRAKGQELPDQVARSFQSLESWKRLEPHSAKTEVLGWSVGWILWLEIIYKFINIYIYDICMLWLHIGMSNKPEPRCPGVCRTLMGSNNTSDATSEQPTTALSTQNIAWHIVSLSDARERMCQGTLTKP